MPEQFKKNPSVHREHLFNQTQGVQCEQIFKAGGDSGINKFHVVRQIPYLTNLLPLKTWYD